MSRGYYGQISRAKEILDKQVAKQPKSIENETHALVREAHELLKKAQSNLRVRYA